MIVPPRKTEAGSAIRRLEAPPFVRFSCESLEVLFDCGDPVRAGDVLARSPRGARLQRRVHSPLAGTVRIEAGRRLIVEGEWPSSSGTEHHDDAGQWEADAIVGRAREAGLLGMGGGMFPTYLKLSYGKPMDTVIINGCEGEPYLSGDHRVLVEHRQEVECGMRLAMRATGATNGHVVGHESNYVAGYERFLVKTTLGRSVPNGCFPVDVGVMVINAQTARALHQAVCGGRPLTERVITVAGKAVERPGNYLVPLGTTVGHILKACEYDASRTKRLVAGGPMMGREVDLDSAVQAGTGGVLALGRKEAAKSAESACIRCGRCMDACPIDLPVTELIEHPASEAVLRCIECGVCQFVCPAHLRLVARLREAKTDYRLRQCQ